jgi:hypothetical protein
MTRPLFRGAILTFCLLLAAALPADAADDGETIVMAKEVVEAITVARKAKDADALTSAYQRLIELHNGMESASWRKKLQVAVGSVLRDKKCEELHPGALGALEELDDGDGVLAQLKPLLPKSADVEVGRLSVDAVTVIGKVKSISGIKVLQGLATKSKNMDVRIAAVETQSNYRHVEKVRVKVLTELLALLTSLQPRNPEVEQSEAQKAEREALQQPVVDTLDRLTRAKRKTALAWLEWYADNKSKLKKAFD